MTEIERYTFDFSHFSGSIDLFWSEFSDFAALVLLGLDLLTLAVDLGGIDLKPVDVSFGLLVKRFLGQVYGLRGGVRVYYLDFGIWVFFEIR